MADADILVELFNARLAVAEAYSDTLLEMCEDETIPTEVIERLQLERDSTIAELTKRIDALRIKIAK